MIETHVNDSYCPKHFFLKPFPKQYGRLLKITAAFCGKYARRTSLLEAVDTCPFHQNKAVWLSQKGKQ